MVEKIYECQICKDSGFVMKVMELQVMLHQKLLTDIIIALKQIFGVLEFFYLIYYVGNPHFGEKMINKLPKKLKKEFQIGEKMNGQMYHKKDKIL